MTEHFHWTDGKFVTTIDTTVGNTPKVIPVPTPPSTPHTSSDGERKELLWEKREETLVHTWIEECRSMALLHHQTAKRLRVIHKLLRFFCSLLPFIGAAFTEELDTFWNKVFFVTITAVTVFTSVLDLGQKVESHFVFSSMYEELKNSMRTEMHKPKKWRIACDVFLKEYELKLNRCIRDQPV